MNPRDVIIVKRDGGTLAPEAIRGFIEGFLGDEVTDYQMTAFLMAVFLRGMDPEETAALTRVMVDTGHVWTWPGVKGRKVDKHSTGGVGDLVSLPLAPLVAAAGLAVPMISGRGLGHTGGTLDKLESIPGLRTGLSEDEFRSVLSSVGFAMGGQTASVAPADKRMYALRDVTGTVESIPLIVSSILSKKAAEGIDALVLDVKCGRGAFMHDTDSALRLARELARVGTLLGLEVVAFVTDMDVPLGDAVGNAVEVEASLRILRGEGPPDLTELVSTLGTAMLVLGGAADSWEAGAERFAAGVTSGEGTKRFRAMVEAQGGDGAVVDDPGRLPAAPVVHPVPAPRAGVVTDLEPRALGEAVVDLGGGRRRAEDTIDPAVGVRLRARPGDRVEAGDPLAEVLAADAATAERVAAERVKPAFTIGDTEPDPRTLVRYLVTGDGHEEWAGAGTWTRSRGKS